MSNPTATGKDDINKTYYIVEFPEEEKNGKLPMAIVPSNWLKNEKTCMWPNNLKGGNKTLIQAAEKMMDIEHYDYLLCPIHIKYGTNYFVKANEKLKMFEETEKGNDTVDTVISDVEDEVVARNSLNTMTLNNSRRNTYTSTKFKDYHLNLSSDDEELPVIPKMTNNSKSKTQKPNTVRESAEFATKRIEQPIINQKSKDDAPELTTFLGLCTKVSVMDGIVNKVYKKVCIMSNKIDTLSEKMEEFSQTRSKIENANGLIENSIALQLHDFPANNIVQLQELDDKLKDTETFSSMCNYFGRIGGRHVLEVTRNILCALISHSLAINMNWTGRNEKFDFKKYGNIINAITVVARNSPKGKEITKVEVANIIKVWLRTAGDRAGGRDKRRSQSSPAAARFENLDSN